jgi:hypothetical protein
LRKLKTLSKKGVAIQPLKTLGSTFGTEATLRPQLIMKCYRTTTQNPKLTSKTISAMTMRTSRMSNTRSKKNITMMIRANRMSSMRNKRNSTMTTGTNTRGKMSSMMTMRTSTRSKMGTARSFK